LRSSLKKAGANLRQLGQNLPPQRLMQKGEAASDVPEADEDG
jgi:hypothetical protein